MERNDHVGHVLEQWRQQAPDLDRSPMGVIGRISRLAGLLQTELEPVFGAHGLNGGEFDVLASLLRAGQPHTLTPTQLSRALMVTSGGMTKRLTALEGMGLIERAPDPKDKRSTTVTLTTEGKRLAETVLPDHMANENRLLAGLSDEEREQLAGLLASLAVSLGDGPATAPRRTATTRRGPPRG